MDNISHLYYFLNMLFFLKRECLGPLKVEQFLHIEGRRMILVEGGTKQTNYMGKFQQLGQLGREMEALLH